jgi:O-antigen ligase
LVISLGFNQIELFYGLFVSNVAILAFIIYSAAINTVFFNPINVRMDCHPLLLIFICFIITYASFGYLIEGDRFLPEYIKFVIHLIFMYFMVIYLISSQLSVLFLTKVFVIGVVISTYPVFDFIRGDEVDLANRFNPIYYGGFNAYGAILSLSIFSSVYLAIKIKTLKLTVFWTMISLYLFLILLITMSRGGFLALLISALVYIYKEYKFKKLFFVIFIMVIIFTLASIVSTDSAIINRFLNINTISDGSGRLQVWSAALNQIFLTPTSFLFGNTIGQFKTEIIGGSTTIQSLHNVFLFLLFSFGILVTLIILTPLIYLFYVTLVKSYKHSAFLSGICAQIIIFMSIDNQFQGLQSGWVFYFWIAVLVYSYNNHKKYRVLA